MPTVVTNLITALAITTTYLVPAPCPDNIPGCLVYHQKEQKTTTYEPVKIQPAFGLESSVSGLEDLFREKYESLDDLPPYIPIYITYKYQNSTITALKHHPVGFISTDLFLKARKEKIKKCYNPLQYVNTNFNARLHSFFNALATPHQTSPFNLFGNY